MNQYYMDDYYLRKSGLSIAGFVIALIAFVFDPCYVLSLLGFIFGVVGSGVSTHPTYKGLGIAAWIIAIISFLLQFSFDMICALCSYGIGLIFVFI